MAETARELLLKILSPEVLDLIEKALLDELKAADKGQVIIETRQHAVHSIFVGHNIIIPKINGKPEIACNP